MNQDEQRRRWQRASRLRDAIIAPLGLHDALVHAAAGLLVQQRHAIGEAKDARLHRLGLLTILFVFVPLVRPEFAAVGQAHFDLKRIAAVHGGRACAGGVELRFDALQQARENLLGADGGQAVGRRGHQFGLLQLLVDPLNVLTVQPAEVASSG